MSLYFFLFIHIFFSRLLLWPCALLKFFAISQLIKFLSKTVNTGCLVKKKKQSCMCIAMFVATWRRLSHKWKQGLLRVFFQQFYLAVFFFLFLLYLLCKSQFPFDYLYADRNLMIPYKLFIFLILPFSCLQHVVGVYH